MAYITPIGFKQYYFSHELDRIQFKTDLPDITINIDGSEGHIYYANVMPTKNFATLYDVSCIIEEYMEANELSVDTLTIYAEEVNGGTVSDEVFATVVYCRQVMPSSILPSDILDRMFLHSSMSKISFKDIPEKLSVFLKNGISYSYYYEVFYSLDGEMVQRFESQPQILNASWRGVRVFDVGYSKGLDLCTDGVGNRPGITIHSLTFHLDDKCFNVYFVQDKPSMIFKFINSFNCVEYAGAWGKLTEKLTRNHSEAIADKMVQFYDITDTTEYDVHISLLNRYHNLLMNEMMYSKKVFFVWDNSKEEEILLYDLKSEQSNEDNQLGGVEFKFKFRNHRPRANISDIVGENIELPDVLQKRIFSNEFNNIFG